MSFTTGRIVKVKPTRIYVIDNYDNRHVFFLDQIKPEDRECLQVNSQVIIHENYEVELASSSFTRWRQERELEELAIATEVTYAGIGE